MDPLDETKTGLWNRSYVVLIGSCQHTGTTWQVFRDPRETTIFINVADADVIGSPQALDYAPSGYDNQSVKGLKVRAGATVEIHYFAESWTTRLDLKGKTGIELCQAMTGGTVCISNLEFSPPRWRLVSVFPFKWVRQRSFLGLGFGKWNPETPAPVDPT